MTNVIYAIFVFIFSPLIYMPFVYWFFKDLEPIKEIMIRVYILLVVSYVLECFFTGNFPTPF